jgi:hypothetical protein
MQGVEERFRAITSAWTRLNQNVNEGLCNKIYATGPIINKRGALRIKVMAFDGDTYVADLIVDENEKMRLVFGDGEDETVEDEVMFGDAVRALV